MGGKKKYINIFGSFTEPFNFVALAEVHALLSAILVKICFSFSRIKPLQNSNNGNSTDLTEWWECWKAEDVMGGFVRNTSAGFLGPFVVFSMTFHDPCTECRSKFFFNTVNATILKQPEQAAEEAVNGEEWRLHNAEVHKFN